MTLGFIIFFENFVDDSIVLRRLKFAGMPMKAPNILSVRWLFPNASWVKVNTGNAVLGGSGIAG